MTTAFHHRHLDVNEVAKPTDVLSAEPERRSVEMAFLTRVVNAAASASSAILGKAAKPGGLSFEADLARMQNPMFKRMARELEQTVPEDAGFGRFREKP